MTVKTTSFIRRRIWRDLGDWYNYRLFRKKYDLVLSDSFIEDVEASLRESLSQSLLEFLRKAKERDVKFYAYFNVTRNSYHCADLSSVLFIPYSNAEEHIGPLYELSWEMAQSHKNVSVENAGDLIARISGYGGRRKVARSRFALYIRDLKKVEHLEAKRVIRGNVNVKNVLNRIRSSMEKNPSSKSLLVLNYLSRESVTYGSVGAHFPISDDAQSYLSNFKCPRDFIGGDLFLAVLPSTVRSRYKGNPIYEFRGLSERSLPHLEKLYTLHPNDLSGSYDVPISFMDLLEGLFKKHQPLSNNSRLSQEINRALLHDPVCTILLNNGAVRLEVKLSKARESSWRYSGFYRLSNELLQRILVDSKGMPKRKGIVPEDHPVRDYLKKNKIPADRVRLFQFSCRGEARIFTSPELADKYGAPVFEGDEL